MDAICVSSLIICGKTRKVCCGLAGILSLNLCAVKMTLKGFGNIHATGNSCRYILPCVCPKSTPELLMKEPLGWCF